MRSNPVMFWWQGYQCLTFDIWLTAYKAKTNLLGEFLVGPCGPLKLIEKVVLLESFDVNSAVVACCSRWLKVVRFHFYSLPHICYWNSVMKGSIKRLLISFSLKTDWLTCPANFMSNQFGKWKW